MCESNSQHHLRSILCPPSRRGSHLTPFRRRRPTIQHLHQEDGGDWAGTGASPLAPERHRPGNGVSARQRGRAELACPSDDEVGRAGEFCMLLGDPEEARHRARRATADVAPELHRGARGVQVGNELGQAARGVLSLVQEGGGVWVVQVGEDS